PSNERAGCRSDRRALPCIPADRATDSADRRSAPGTADHLAIPTTRCGRCWRPGLLAGPTLTLRLILLLLLRALPSPRLDHLAPGRSGQDGDGPENEENCHESLHHELHRLLLGPCRAVQINAHFVSLVCKASRDTGCSNNDRAGAQLRQLLREVPRVRRHAG